MQLLALHEINPSSSLRAAFFLRLLMMKIADTQQDNSSQTVGPGPPNLNQHLPNFVISNLFKKKRKRVSKQKHKHSASQHFSLLLFSRDIPDKKCQADG